MKKTYKNGAAQNEVRAAPWVLQVRLQCHIKIQDGVAVMLYDKPQVTILIKAVGIAVLTGEIRSSPYILRSKIRQ